MNFKTNGFGKKLNLLVCTKLKIKTSRLNFSLIRRLTTAMESKNYSSFVIYIKRKLYKIEEKLDAFKIIVCSE